MAPRKHLLITHIPFSRAIDGGAAIVDGLWARDLAGLVASTGTVRVLAPELSGQEPLQTWGPNSERVMPESGIQFAGFPAITGNFQWWRWQQVRAIIRREVDQADLIQTSNGFPPYQGLAYAHDYAVRQGKKTLLVVAEDFHDMLDWEWVRESRGILQRSRRRLQLAQLDLRVRKSAATASLTFLHTPAAVLRYRDVVKQGFAIRQPGHELADVISQADFDAKRQAIAAGAPLVIVAACRHKPLKGLDFLVRAGSLLKQRGIPVTIRLYGSGESTPELKRVAERYDVEDSVEFPGTLPPGPDIYAAIASGHVFAMPHRTTDFGRAFYDAMAGGTPVVAFRTPASIDTVREGQDGLICPLDDAESLASTLQRLHEDRPLLIRLTDQARARAIRETRSVWYEIRARRVDELF